MSLDKILSDVGAELRRLGKHGSAELASALFSGHSFVPDGPGQYTPSPQIPLEQSQAHDAPPIERCGREM